MNGETNNGIIVATGFKTDCPYKESLGGTCEKCPVRAECKFPLKDVPWSHNPAARYRRKSAKRAAIEKFFRVEKMCAANVCPAKERIIALECEVNALRKALADETKARVAAEGLLVRSQENNRYQGEIISRFCLNAELPKDERKRVDEIRKEATEAVKALRSGGH